MPSINLGLVRGPEGPQGPQGPEATLSAQLLALNALTGTGLVRRTGENTFTLDNSAYLTGNQSISLTGDLTGSGTTSINATLSASGVSAGTYNNSATQTQSLTVDAKGRVTAVGTPKTIQPNFSDVQNKPTTLAGYGIMDAQAKSTSLGNLAGLAGTSGVPTKTGADTWELKSPFNLAPSSAITTSVELGPTEALGKMLMCGSGASLRFTSTFSVGDIVYGAVVDGTGASIQSSTVTFSRANGTGYVVIPAGSGEVTAGLLSTFAIYFSSPTSAIIVGTNLS